MRYHLTPIRMAKKTREETTDFGEDVELGEPFTLLVEIQTGAVTLKTAWRFLKKLKIDLLYDPAIAPVGIYPKDTKMLIQRDTCTTMIIAALLTIARVCNESKGPLTEEWRNI